MRIFKLVVAMLAVLALSSIAVSTSASAEITLWKWLSGAAGQHFGGRSGKAEVQIKGSGTITCKESKFAEKESELTSPVTSATLALAVLSLSGCKAFGLASQSLGAASGVIAVHLELHTCMIAPEHYGMIFTMLPVHVDIPSTGLLVELTASFVVLVEGGKGKTFNLNIDQKEGVQAIEKCEGGEALTLLSSVDSGNLTQSGATAKEASITFSENEQDPML